MWKERRESQPREKERERERTRAQQQYVSSVWVVERQRVTGSGNRVVGPGCKREPGPASAATAIMANNSLSDCQALRRPGPELPHPSCALRIHGVPQKYGFRPIINPDRLNTTTGEKLPALANSKERLRVGVNFARSPPVRLETRESERSLNARPSKTKRRSRSDG